LSLSRNFRRLSAKDVLTLAINFLKKALDQLAA